MGSEVLKGVLPFSQEVVPGGLGLCDPRYWGELGLAWPRPGALRLKDTFFRFLTEGGGS